MTAQPPGDACPPWCSGRHETVPRPTFTRHAMPLPLALPGLAVELLATVDHTDDEASIGPSVVLTIEGGTAVLSPEQARQLVRALVMGATALDGNRVTWPEREAPPG